MASYCFCGCGQQVRFGKKKFSNYGAEVRGLLAVLENVGVPVISQAGDEVQLAKLKQMIEDGKYLEVTLEGMVHGAPVQIPPIGDIRSWMMAAHRMANAFYPFMQAAAEES